MRRNVAAKLGIFDVSAIFSVICGYSQERVNDEGLKKCIFFKKAERTKKM